MQAAPIVKHSAALVADSEIIVHISLAKKESPHNTTRLKIEFSMNRSCLFQLNIYSSGN